MSASYDYWNQKQDEPTKYWHLEVIGNSSFSELIR